jgi:hypothetical protein
LPILTVRGEVWRQTEKFFLRDMTLICVKKGVSGGSGRQQGMKKEQKRNFAHRQPERARYNSWRWDDLPNVTCNGTGYSRFLLSLRSPVPFFFYVAEYLANLRIRILPKGGLNRQKEFGVLSNGLRDKFIKEKKHKSLWTGLGISRFLLSLRSLAPSTFLPTHEKRAGGQCIQYALRWCEVKEYGPSGEGYLPLDRLPQAFQLLRGCI